MIILFLCTGNSCRSPMAAAMFSRLCPEDITILSAGTCAYPGGPASAHAIAAVVELGADCSAHASQQATPELLAQADFVICLAKNHALQAKQLVAPKQLRVLGGGVSDPFGGSLDDYRTCAAQIQAALPGLLPDITCNASIISTEEAHIPAIAELSREVFAQPASETRLREKLTLDTCHMLTALLDGQVTGFITVDEIASEAFIDDIAVFPAHQRKGIASRLLAQAEVNAILRGCEKMHLEVRESNLGARKLYETRAFRQVGTRPGFYKAPTEDAILKTLEFR